MTSRAVRAGTENRSARRKRWQIMRPWAVAHVVDDFFEGLVPAAIPFFVLERHLSYTQASGLALASTFGSALPQVLVGVVADRVRAPWLSAVGLLLAGVGAGLAGLAPTYGLVFLAFLLSGIGIAIFHPPVGRDARIAAAGSATAMGYFAAGGSLGFFIAPVLVTPALNNLGLGATALFIPPALLMAFVLLRASRRLHGRAVHDSSHAGRDKPRQFAVLVGVEIIRSIVFFGLNTFISLYWIRQLGASAAMGGLALSLLLGGGVLGVLLGGRLADRFGLVRTTQIGTLAICPAIVLLLLVQNPIAALPLVTLVGVVASIPVAVLVKLGQDYLPSRPGTAAGVTLGLALSAGGLFMPVLGLIADARGLQAVLMTLAAIPLLASALAALLKEPSILDANQPSGTAGSSCDAQTT